jgi:hypothetical protein
MRRRASKALALVSVPLLTLVLAACGGGGTNVGQGFQAPKTGAGNRQAAAFDPRDATLACFKAKGVQAEKDPRFGDRVDILPTTSQAFVTYTSSPDDAQSRAIRNDDDAAGAEAIGPHLLTTGDLSDDVLQKLEDCLDAQGVRY